MSRQQRRRQEREIRDITAKIQRLREQNVLPKPKGFFSRIKDLFKGEK